MLGIQLVCYLPARSEGNFAYTGPRAGERVGDPSIPLGPITGTITDNNGKPLPGVSVTIRGAKKGVTTDATGSFTVNAKNGDILVISMIGFKTKEIPVGTQTALTIGLEPFSAEMTEVVVTALGIKKQARSLGYSTTEVAGSELTQSRELNIGDALTGQVAGVSVAGLATGPYGSSRVTIRGNSSISQNNQPLYVIDGVPFDNSNQGYAGQWGGTDLGDGLSNINPDDIESIQVLKGVAASALYGYRGGNGAILITTKSGAKNKGVGVEVNNNLTANRVIDYRDYQYQYGQGALGVKPANQAAALQSPYYSWGAPVDGSPAVNFLGDTYNYSPYKKNFENFYKTGITNQGSIALSGSNDKGHFRLGISDLYMGAVIPNSNMKQQIINFNSTYNVLKNLQVTLTANYIFEDVKNRANYSDAPGNVIASSLYLANTFDIRWMKNNRLNPDGTELLPGADQYFENPYYLAYNYQNTTSRNRLTGALSLKYNILDWLYIQGQIQRDGYVFDVFQVTPSGVEYTRADGVHGGNLTQYEDNFREINGSFMIGANKKFGDHFSFNANAGGNEQDDVTQYYGVGAVPNSGNGPAGPFQIAGFYSANNISTKPFGINYSHLRVNSLYGSADLGFNNYLFLSGTTRTDWFTTLNYNTDNHTYPSVSASFVFTDAFKLPWWVSFGKIRASYAGGSTGDQTAYQNILTYGLQGYTVSGQPVGYVAGQGIIPNAKLEPVKIAEKEAGANLQFLNNRAGIDIAYYDKQTTKDLVQVTASPTSGYNSAVKNIGMISNKGVEVLLTATPVKTRDFSWDVSFNFAQNNSKVLYVGGDSTITVGGAFPRWGSEVAIQDIVGRAYDQIVGYGYVTDSKGQRVFKNGEPVQTTNVIPFGSSIYKQTGGFSNTFTYKAFSLQVLFDFKYGAKIYSGTNLLLDFYGLQKNTLAGRGADGNGKIVAKGDDIGGGPNTTAVGIQQYWQDISAGGADHIAQEFIYDASFIKLRSAHLTYSLPAKTFQGTPIKGINVSVVARNLWTVMKHTPNIDPESNLNNTNGQGLELSGYPALRSYGVNVNVKF